MAFSTSAKASVASSADGSLAIDGCIASKLMRWPERSALASRCSIGGGIRPPAGSRQRRSKNLARPSCSQTGARSLDSVETA